MDLRIVGGHVALDLANTVAPRPPATVEVDYLPDPSALLGWARRVELVGETEVARIGDEALADVLALRELVGDVLAGRRLDVLGRRWAEAMGRTELTAAGGGAATLTVGTDPRWMIGDRLADAVVDLVRHADLSRLRVCPLDEGGCGWYFLDRSRNQTRRWCSMDDCGTQAKSRRLTERRRSRRP